MKFSTAEFLRDFVEPHGQQVEAGESYHYVDHADDIGLLAYSKDTYVFVSIPLGDLLKQVTLSQARAVMKRHNIPCGSRESLSTILARLEHHNGLCCTHNKTVFIKRLTKPMSPIEKWHKRPKTKSKTFSGASELKLDGPCHVFPPHPLDKNLSQSIIREACSRMKSQNISETGCAVCGELRPLCGMSRLKAIKQQLQVLTAPGVSRVERKDISSPLREYKGPVLDYNCKMVCNSCRGSIRKGKIPKLSLANGLWIGDVPPQLKCSNFVEKLLVAYI